MDRSAVTLAQWRQNAAIGTVNGRMLEVQKVSAGRYVTITLHNDVLGTKTAGACYAGIEPEVKRTWWEGSVQKATVVLSAGSAVYEWSRLEDGRVVYDRLHLCESV